MALKSEDWSNDDEKLRITGINYILTYIKIKKVILNCNISHFYCIFAQGNAVLHKRLKKKNLP